MIDAFLPVFIGPHTADAEQVQIAFSMGSLVLQFVDYKEEHCRFEFHDTLAFRWQERDDAETPRDDTTYRVIGSRWLREQVADIPNREAYAHYKLCFNACGVLDLLCREIPDHAEVPLPGDG